MCLGTFSRLWRSLAISTLYATVRILAERFLLYREAIFCKAKKHPAPARCSIKNIQFLPAYIFNVANIISLISKYYFRLLRYGITQVDLALHLFYNMLLSSSNISFLCSYQYLRIIRNIFSLPTGFIV